MKKAIKNILKWCLIITLIGFLCEISSTVVFILLVIFIYKVAIKKNSAKSTLQGGINMAQKGVNKLKG